MSDIWTQIKCEICGTLQRYPICNECRYYINDKDDSEDFLREEDY